MKPKTNLRHAMVFLAVCTGLLLSGPAATPCGAGVQAAVICGITDYKYLEPKDELMYPAKDALDMYNKCIEYGVPKNNIKLLMDKKASKRAIQSAIKSAGSRTSIPDGAPPIDTGGGGHDHGSNDKLVAGDVFLFYFSGHGFYGDDLPPYDEPDRVDEYIAPYDTLPTSYANDIRDEELEEWLIPVTSLGVRVLVIIDACYAGGAIKPAVALNGPKGGIRVKRNALKSAFTKKSPGGFAKSLSKPGYTLMTSSSFNESSYEWEWFQNGVFTHLLLSALSGVADDSYLPGGVGNDSGAITDTELFYGAMALNNGYFNALKVIPELKYGIGFTQTPQVYGDNWWVLFNMK